MKFVGLLVTLAFAGASERPDDPDLRAAVEKYVALDFEEVMPHLKNALNKDLSTSDRIIALAYTGRVHAIFQREDEAVEAFQRLLAQAPDYEVEAYESRLIHIAFRRAVELRIKKAQKTTAAQSEESTPNLRADKVAAVKGSVVPRPVREGTIKKQARVAPEARSPTELPHLATVLPPEPTATTLGSRDRRSIGLVIGPIGVALITGIILGVTKPWKKNSPPATTLGEWVLP